MQDEWALLTVSENFKADLQDNANDWNMPGSVDSTAWKEKWKKRIKANWCGSLLCVQRRVKIKHFNNFQVHWIKQYADKVLKFNTPAPVVTDSGYHFSLSTLVLGSHVKNEMRWQLTGLKSHPHNHSVALWGGACGEGLVGRGLRLVSPLIQCLLMIIGHWCHPYFHCVSDSPAIHRLLLQIPVNPWDTNIMS